MTQDEVWLAYPQVPRKEDDDRAWGEYKADLATLGSVCMSCLHDLIRIAVLHCKANGFPSEHFSISFWLPYPNGTQLPIDDESLVSGMMLALVWRDGEMMVSFSILDILGADRAALRRRLDPLLRACDAKIFELSKKPEQNWAGLEIQFPYGMQVKDVAQACMKMDITLRRVVWDLRDPMDVFSIVFAGQVDRLLGVKESATVDAKEAHYYFDIRRQKFEFAADVASFANSREGGLILVGIKTKKDSFGCDILDEIVGCKLIRGQLDKYYNVAENLICPPVANLRIEACDFDGRQVVAILVPPQLEAVKPFLLRCGTIDGEKVSSSMFSFPIRSGDRKRYVTAERIQAVLSSVRDFDIF